MAGSDTNFLGSIMNKGSQTFITPELMQQYGESIGWTYNENGTFTTGTGDIGYVSDKDLYKFAKQNGMVSSASQGIQGIGKASAALDSGVRSLPSFPEESAGSAAANGLFDGATSIMEKIPGAEQYAGFLKAAKLGGDVAAAVGLTNDGMTGIDQVSQNGIGNLLLGVVGGNNIFTKKTQDYSVDEEMLQNVGGSYGGTASDLYAAQDKAGKKYGWMSSHARKKADKAISEAKAMQRNMQGISNEAADQRELVDWMGDAARSAYAMQLGGGYNQAAIHVAEGGKINVKEKRRMSGDGPQVWIIPPEEERPSCPVMAMEQEMEAMPDEEMIIIITDMSPEGQMRGCPEAGKTGHHCPADGLQPKQNECPIERKVEEVAEEFEPEIISIAEAIAKEAIMEMKEEMPCGPSLTCKRPTRRKTADGLDLILSFEPAFEPEIIPPFVPEIISGFTPEIVEPGLKRHTALMGGHGMGFSYSSGMSRSETTRNMPGIGPVTVVEERRMKPQFRTYGMSYKSGGSVAKREKIEKQLDAPQIEESGQMNLIPEGSLHKNRHHMDGAEDYTKKGIPVVDLHGPAEQEAEIEREEIIFNKEVTNALEELYAVYYDEGSTPEEKDEAALEAGKLITREVMLNTDDRTGLIGRMKRGGKMQDGGKVYEGRSLDELVRYAEETNPRFVQRLNEFPMILGFDLGDGREHGSHLLSYSSVQDDDGNEVTIVYPMIMEKHEGKGDLKLYGDGKKALNEALKRGDYLEMTEDEAELFTGHYKEHYNNYMKEFDAMENYLNSHPKADPVKVRKSFIELFNMD